MTDFGGFQGQEALTEIHLPVDGIFFALTNPFLTIRERK
jgi:hypothetical protein